MHHRFILGLISAACAAATARAGWEYTAETQAAGGRAAEMQNLSTHALVDGARARIEFTSSRNPMMQAGTYLLTSDGGKMAYLVNPARKVYSPWDMNAMMGMAGGMMSMMNMKVADQKIEKLAEEKGPSMLGLPTTHYKFRTSYTMVMNFMGMKQSHAVSNEEELWTTTALKDDAFAFAALRRGTKSGNEEFDKLIAAQMSKAQGFPLKMVTKTQSTDARGNAQETTVTMVVTELKKASPAASTFALPEGYTQQEFSPLGAIMGGANAPAGEGPKPGGGDNPFLKLLQEQMKNK